MSSLLCLWALLFLSACERQTGFDAVHINGHTMGTTYSVIAVLEPGMEAPSGLDRRIEDWLAEVNQSMSTYISDSEIAELNRAPLQEWLPISPMMAEVLQLSQEIAELSGGAFDVTVAPLVDIWGFGPVDTGDQVPSDAALERARARVGYEHLSVRLEPPAIRKNADIQLDLSAIAKGFGADYLGRQLQSLGFENYLVEIGGDLVARGSNQQGRPWRIGVEKPTFTRQAVQEVLALNKAGVATSGDYRNFYERDGQIYTHIVDPRLGRPVRSNLMSVTVVADTAARADGLATAITVMGEEEAAALAEQEGLAVYLIIRKHERLETWKSSAFNRYIANGR